MKRSKDEVDYSQGMEKSHCGKLTSSDEGNCRHFIALKATETGRCDLVEGPIKRSYWCKLWERA